MALLRCVSVSDRELQRLLKILIDHYKRHKNVPFFRKNRLEKESLQMKSISFRIENYIAYVTINRPEVLNCFNYDTLSQLQQVVDELHIAEDVRAVILQVRAKRHLVRVQI